MRPGPIDTYLTELDSALRGPRRAKDDLLTEARDHLLEAAADYEHDGLGRAAAECSATRDFGTVEEVLPGYQAELGLTQGRRTVLAVLGMSAAQPLVWLVFRQVSGTVERPNGPDDIIETLGGLTILLALLAVMAYRVGMRFPAVRARLTRLTGVVAFGVAAMFASFSTVLTVLTARPDTYLVNLLWTVAFVLVPAVWIAVSARRCLVIG